MEFVFQFQILRKENSLSQIGKKKHHISKGNTQKQHVKKSHYLIYKKSKTSHSE